MLLSLSNRTIICSKEESSSWSPNSWKRKTHSKFIPLYKNKDKLETIKNTLKYNRPPLVFANEIIQLNNDLKLVHNKEAFIIQGGDCAESIDNYDYKNVMDLVRLLIQMALIVSYNKHVKVIKIARAGGQFSKPRTNNEETQISKTGEKVTLPSYFGDSINKLPFTENDRIIDETRMLLAHDVSANTLNLIRSMSTSGYLSLNRLNAWMYRCVFKKRLLYHKYIDLFQEMNKSLKLLSLFGIDASNEHKLNTPVVYTSHEALLLHYEECMTRKDSISNEIFDCSAHFLWIGDRTRDLDGAHIEFARGIHNPIGIKIGPNANITDIIKIIDTLNPLNHPGKITLICRFGNEYILDLFPDLILEIKKQNKNVIWMLDPMHGNNDTFTDGKKTRYFKKILNETKLFFDICKTHDIYPGGVHLEMCAIDDSAECVGGLINIEEEDVKRNYKSNCDPRLNLAQSIEYAFELSKLM